MKKQNLCLLVAATSLVLSAVTTQASLTLNYSSIVGTGIQFNGASSSFQLNPAPGSVANPEFQVTSETGGSAALGLYGWISGSPWTIGTITTSGSLQSATVSGVGTLYISDGSGNYMTGTVNWMTIQTDASAGAINAALAVNITGLSYSGANVDLLALAGDGSGSMNLTFQFNPALSLSQLVQNPDQTTSFSGSLVGAAVPEPTTVIAGALLLLPLGASTLRIIAKRRFS